MKDKSTLRVQQRTLCLIFSASTIREYPAGRAGPGQKNWKRWKHMFESTGFGKTLDIMKRSMKVNLQRRDVISDNIANADTPNFKRSEISFESALKDALASEKARRFPVTLTHEKHIPFDRSVDYRTVRPRKVLDYMTQSKNNGNNVDLEEEMMSAMHNQLSYQLMAQIVSNQFSQVNLVLR